MLKIKTESRRFIVGIALSVTYNNNVTKHSFPEQLDVPRIHMQSFDAYPYDPTCIKSIKCKKKKKIDK